MNNPKKHESTAYSYPDTNDSITQKRISQHGEEYARYWTHSEDCLLKEVLKAPCFPSKDYTLLDVGCGEGGDLTLMLCNRCKHVTALDCDPKVVSGLQKLLKQKNIQNVSPKVADMVKTGLPDNFADLVLMSQVLHHATDPRLAIKEAVRILKSGGTLALLDLAQHKEESFRTTHGHIWLGFDRSQLEFFVKEFNCEVISSEIIPSENEVDKKLPVICMILKKK